VDGLRTIRFETVDAMVCFDLECPISAGGTRLAIDLTETEVALLARAMTYKLAIIGQRIGGAKAGIRATVAEREEALRRFRDEVRPLVEAQRFLTSSDLGTTDADLADLIGEEASHMTAQREGLSADAWLTGLGVVVAAETALGSLRGRTVAIEGFGKVGSAAAREFDVRGARVVAVSTAQGCIHDPAGLDVSRLWVLRQAHGDGLVDQAGLPVQEPEALFGCPAEVLVPGARVGVLDVERASRVTASVVAPAANVPYTADGLNELQRRGIVALADFVCNLGATIFAGQRLSYEEGRIRVEETIRELTRLSGRHPHGHLAGAAAAAEEFLATWVGPGQMPDGPALAGRWPGYRA
jgi:glutamate dehydrogenase (NAD(P)+)